MRRSALMKVPSFSRKEVPGRNTCANFAVSFRNRSCTTTHSIAAQGGFDVVRVWIRLREVLALDIHALELPGAGGVEHVRDAEARLGIDLDAPVMFKAAANFIVGYRAGSPAARAGTNPCRRNPARCSGRAAG